MTTVAGKLVNPAGAAVAGFAPFSGVDAAAGPGTFYAVACSPGKLTADANAGQSASWTFTTAP